MPQASLLEMILGAIVIAAVVFLVQQWEIALALGGAVMLWRGFVLWQNSPAQKEREAKAHTNALYESVIKAHGFNSDEDLEEARLRWGRPIYEALPPLDDELELTLLGVALTLYDLEQFDIAIPKPPAVCNSLEGARYRDSLSSIAAKTANPAAKKAARTLIIESYTSMLNALPQAEQVDGDIWGTISLEACGDARHAVQALILPYYDELAASYGLFAQVRDALDANLRAASGVTDPHVAVRVEEAVTPDVYDGPDVAQTYLANTPFQEIFDTPVPFKVPHDVRYEHTMVVGGSGHGKTTLLADMILGDIERARNGGGGFAVIDPKGSLIEQLSQLECFAPDTGDLADRLIVVDPKRDVEYPPAMNMFDLGLDDTDDLDLADRLTLRNNALEMIDYMFSELLDVEMTGRQEVAFNYVGDLMMHVPGATVLTLLDFLNNPHNYTDAIAACDNTTRAYLENQFLSDRFKSVRDQLSDRVYGVLKLPMMEAMFSHAKTKVNLVDAVNDGKIVLINANENFLSTGGSSVFGSIWIGLLFQACVSRITVPEHERLGFTLYVDEASMYFSEKLRQLLIKAREFRLGVVFAFQDLEMIESPQLRASALGSTSTKLVGGLNAKDRKNLAAEMNTTDEFLRRPRKNQHRKTTEFACFVRGHTELPVILSYELGKLARQPKMSEAQFEQLIDANRAVVSANTELTETQPEEAQPTALPAASDGDLPFDPSFTIEETLEGAED